MDLVSKMDEYLADTGLQAYSDLYMKKRLLEHFENDIVITEINGKQNVVTLRTTAASIVHDFYFYGKDEDSQANQLRIVETAAKLIKNARHYQISVNSIFKHIHTTSINTIIWQFVSFIYHPL